MLAYRETDLDNVLQIPTVFFSVSKGQSAPHQDLAKSFGAKMSTDDIILEILNKGELQVGEKERNAQMERVHNEVISIVAGKLVDPTTKRVYTTGMIDKALTELSGRHTEKKDVTEEGGEGAADGDKPKEKAKELPNWTGVDTKRSSKSQALDAMKALIAHQPIPVIRARMRLRVTCHTSVLKQAAKPSAKVAGEEAAEKVKGTVKDRILSYVEEVQDQSVDGDEWEVTGFVEPGAFKALGEFISGETKGKGRVEVLDMAVVHEGDERG
jgi:ribosome maturation protein SDO1